MCFLEGITVYRFIKRSIDVLLSGLGMIISSPLWLVALIGIKASDPGPAFYLANRVGKNDVVFKMYKFRSMRQGKANEAVFRGDEDRIFPFGEFIRRTKIDELPQLINIFKGDMSIVGPRPAAVDQMAVVRAGKYAEVSRETAGLTGPSALYDYIYGDNIEDAADYENLVLPTRLQLDLYYVNHMSLLADIKWIWYTVLCIVYTIFGKQPEKILNELIGLAEKAEI